MSWAGITRIFLAYSFQQRLFQTIQTPATAPVPEFSSIYDTLKNLPPYWFPTLSATYDCLCMSSRQTYVIAMMPSLWLHLCLPDGHECNLQIAGLTCPKLPSRPLALCSGGRLLEEKAGDGLRQLPSPPLLHRKRPACSQVFRQHAGPSLQYQEGLFGCSGLSTLSSRDALLLTRT